MQPSIFAYIRQHSWRQQLTILGLTLLSFPPLYYSLELPKIIINDALGEVGGQFHFLGYEVGQLTYLFLLCGVFLGLVLLGGLFKYVMNVYAGIVAERMLRRLRYELYDHVLRFPLPHFRRVSQGELVQMINAETEAIGGYIGEALATPAFQGGTLLTILLFMFMQDPILGLAAIALYPLQMYVIPKLQRQVNNLGKLRVRQVRRNAERISETVMGVRDIRANGTLNYERARFADQLGTVFWIRFDIYKKKFLIKFINNFLAQLGPFFFFSIGGYLVLQGDLTLGALVAVVAAQKDLASPWKELLTHYQLLYDVKIKYEQTVAQFAPPGLLAARAEAGGDGPLPELRGPLHASNLTIAEDGEPQLDGVSFSIEMPSRVALVGPAGGGKEELALAVAGLLHPTSGRVLIGETDVYGVPQTVLGRAVVFIGSPPYVFGGTLADNLLYGLKYQPYEPLDLPPEARQRRERYRKEALESGNSVSDPSDDWIDFRAAGIEDEADRLPAIVRALEVATLEQDVYIFGLNGTARDGDGDLPERLLEARGRMQKLLASEERLARLVEPFDADRYNNNATLAENLLFGAAVGPEFGTERLAAQPYVLATLDRARLTEELREVGFRVAETMVELFADLPPDHEYFRQFSFIAPDDLADYRALVSRADPARLGDLSAGDRERLLSLPFKLINARHRLGLITPELEAKILDARRLFREHLPEELRGSIAFFNASRYNAPSSIQDNIIFGKIAYGQPQAQARVAELITRILEELGLRGRVTEAGLDAECGVGGGRLSAPQRQKLAIARAVLKRPAMLVLHGATAALDPNEQQKVRDALLEEFEGRTIVWSIPVQDWANLFDHVLVLEQGRLVSEGAYTQADDKRDTPQPQDAAAE